MTAIANISPGVWGEPEEPEERRQEFVPVEVERRRGGSRGFMNAVHTAIRQGVELPTYATEGLDGAFELSRPERYQHLKTTELERPDLAVVAWRIHAASYLAEKFVGEESLVDDGTGAGYKILSPDIDKAREPGVHVGLWMSYHHTALEPVESGLVKYVMTFRELSPVEGQDYRSLPAFHLSGDHLDQRGLDLLAQLHAEGRPIHEIAALSRDPDTNGYVFHELFRNGLHAAIHEDAETGLERAWLHTIVRDTYDKVTPTLGKWNFDIIGTDVAPTGEGVKEGLTLVPAVLYPSKFMANLLRSLNDARDELLLEPDETRRQKLKELAASLKWSFMHYTDGLHPRYLSKYPEVIAAREEIKTQQRNKRSK